MKELLKYKYLVYELVKRDLKKKYKRSILGILWSLLNPLLMMLITAMVFSNLFKFNIQNFPVYLLSGQIIFTFFSESTTFAMGSILDNASLIKKIYIPKYLFPLSRVLSSCINLALTIPALIVILIITNQGIDIGFLKIIIPIILLIIFNFGVGLILSTVGVFFRDIFHLYGVVLSALSYSTPIFYPENIVPIKYIIILKLNPLYYYLKLFRDIIYFKNSIDFETLGICIGISLVTLIIGVVSFIKKEKKFILYI